MIKQECIGIPDLILLLMIFFCVKKIKIKAEIVVSPMGPIFKTRHNLTSKTNFWILHDILDNGANFVL